MTLLPLNPTSPCPQAIEDYIAKPSIDGLRELLINRPPIEHMGRFVSAVYSTREEHPEISRYLTQIELSTRFKLIGLRMPDAWEQVRLYDNL